MGYTHYFYIPKEFDKEKFATLSEELKTAADLLPEVDYNGKECHVTLGDGHGDGLPEFTKEKICFNGTNKDDYSHETFFLQADNSEEYKRKSEGASSLVGGGLMFDCCKTNCKPYDIMVCISLLRLLHHFPECKVSSDGGGPDWKGARTLYKKIFGVAPPKVEY